MVKFDHSMNKKGLLIHEDFLALAQEGISVILVQLLNLS